MQATSTRGAIIFATGLEEKTISRQFAPQQSGMLLEYVLDSAWTVADELFVVFSREPKLSLVEAISPFGAKVLTVPKNQTPIRALADAFRSSKSEYSLLATERVPFLKPNVALNLFENARGNDGAIPKWDDGRIEPLLAVYRRNDFTRIINAWKHSFGQNVAREITLIAEQLFDVKFLSIERELKELDPELDSFYLVRDEKSLAAAREKASIKGRKVQLKKIMKQYR
jgi:molybdopterin-guanine dinucleotide biosynthesis protein A